MPHVRRFVCLSAALTFLAWAPTTRAEQPAVDKKPDPKKTYSSQFIRLKRDAKEQPVALETATVRYAAPGEGGVVVDLVAAVHVGDRGYYQALNKQFEQ